MGGSAAVSDEAVRFWHAVGDDSREVAGAYLGAGPRAAHVHEDWQFAVPENPARLSMGAYRRHMMYHPAIPLRSFRSSRYCQWNIIASSLITGSVGV